MLSQSMKSCCFNLRTFRMKIQSWKGKIRPSVSKFQVLMLSTRPWKKARIYKFRIYIWKWVSRAACHLNFNYRPWSLNMSHRSKDLICKTSVSSNSHKLKTDNSQFCKRNTLSLSNSCWENLLEIQIWQNTNVKSPSTKTDSSFSVRKLTDWT